MDCVYLTAIRDRFAGFCKHDKEILGPMKGRKFLGELSECQLLKKAAAL